MFYSKKLKKYKEIKHCFFSRKGGFSSGIYKELNCGKGSEDKNKNILKNLKRVAGVMNVKLKHLILMNQTHSNKVLEINKKNYTKKINSDAMITNMNGIVLGVLTADCVPILIYDKKNKIIGCIHAGWKGAFKGVIKNTISKMRKKNANCEIFGFVDTNDNSKTSLRGIFFTVKLFDKTFLRKSLSTSCFFIKILLKKFTLFCEYKF